MFLFYVMYVVRICSNYYNKRRPRSSRSLPAAASEQKTKHNPLTPPVADRNIRMNAEKGDQDPSPPSPSASGPSGEGEDGGVAAEEGDADGGGEAKEGDADGGVEAEEGDADGRVEAEEGGAVREG